MIRLLRFLITGSLHEHKWIEVSHDEVNYFDDLHTPELKSFSKTMTTYNYKCEVFGLHKIQRVRTA